MKHPAAEHILRDTTATAAMKDETLLKQVQPIEGLSDEQIRSMISEMNGISGCRCPSCKEFNLEFDLAKPDIITCTNCNTVYPNDKFPCDRIVEATNPLGHKVRYEALIEGGYHYFIPAKIRRERHLALSRAALASAWLYRRRGEERYAHLALVIMDRFAEVYPGWCVHHDHRLWKKGVAEHRPWPHFGGKWEHWYPLDMPIDLILAYDLIYDSMALKEFSATRDYNVKERIENFFRSAYRFILECYEDQGKQVGNMTPYTCRHFIACGRVIDDPDMIHTAVAWMRRLCEQHFFFDGMWHEGTLGYHSQTTWNLSRAARALKGYSDPEGYRDEKHGIKLKDADFYVDYPFMEQVAKTPYRMLYPDGNWYRVHDTGWTRKADPPDYLNIEFNAYGHFAIGRGKEENITQAHLHFCPMIWGSHYHTDRLNMTFFGAGREMISDIGYARTKHRYFATSLIGHNLVAVDWTWPKRIPEDVEHSAGRPTKVNNYPKSSLLAYDPGATSDKWVQLIEAESPDTFCTNLAKYRRALLLIGADDERSYVVDIFRVEGGSQHDWLLHGTCDEDMEMATDAALTPLPGTLASRESEYGQIVKGAPSYSWLVDDLRVAEADKGLKFIWTGRDSGAALKVWLLPMPGTRAIFGQAPSYHRAGGTWAAVDRYKMPYLDLRRSGDAPNASAFVAVYDVSKAGQRAVVDEVMPIVLEPADPWATAISVRCSNRTDIIYTALDDIPRKVGDCTCAARFAVISAISGKTDYVFGWDFWKLTFPEGELTARPPAPLRLAGTLRAEDGDRCDGLIVEGEVPEVNFDRAWVRVVHGDGTAHGYVVANAEAMGEGKTLLTTRGDPGVRVTPKGIKMAKFPHWEIEGPNHIEIFNSACLRLRQENAPVLKVTLPNAVEWKLK